MKTVDISDYQVVKVGVPCQTSHPFKLETIINIMEKNETYIYWLQPPHGGIQQQVACVCINNQYYQLNLKLEKAIFRHIRLCKNFINSEKLADGSQKLRIPQRLLREKLRTSMRSKVSACTRVACMRLFVYVTVYVTVIVSIFTTSQCFDMMQAQVKPTAARQTKRKVSKSNCKTFTFDVKQVCAYAESVRQNCNAKTQDIIMLPDAKQVADNLKQTFALEFPHVDLATVFV